MTDTAETTLPYCEPHADLSVWGVFFRRFFVEQAPTRVKKIQARGRNSSSVDSAKISELLTDLDAWFGGVDEKGTECFVPKTERGRRLWKLRQKYIANGGRLYSLDEIQRELDEQRAEA
jgi:hypothetical protein